MKEMTDPEAIEKFIKAGKATITLKSKKTGNHFTFRIDHKVVHPARSLYFVNLVSPEVPDEHHYLGMINDGRRFERSRATTKEALNSQGFMVFQWFWKWLKFKRCIPDDLLVYHEDKCGRCGNPLTNPESIELGYGPECIRYVR